MRMPDGIARSRASGAVVGNAVVGNVVKLTIILKPAARQAVDVVPVASHPAARRFTKKQKRKDIALLLIIYRFRI